MPRRIRTQFERALGREGAKAFGQWLALKRELARLSQEKAAQAVGVSRRQWIRYEQGAVVPEKRMKVIAKVVRVPLGKLLQRAGYRTSPKRNDVRARLQSIHDMLIAGSMEGALNELLLLHRWIELDKRKVPPETDGTTAANFAMAVILLDKLPEWLFTVIAGGMQNKIGAKRQGSNGPLKLKMHVLEEAMDLLRHHSSDLKLPTPNRKN